ncbi:hypothetical protein J437_LFUL018431 [Ladona fulva]|uniref:Uncharacterized protein n=1 Tax=Ladona fulva TaxID=123851 RepID=A0A8K0KSI8_LADFU|nr:hypothetical protein J437_LFUL018431 [Ladona fulva]
MIVKQRTNWHRHDMYELDSENKPVQSGTAVFIKELSSRHFPSADDIILKMAGQQLTVPFLQRNGFNDPILITQKDGLGMIVPPEAFTVDDVEYYVGKLLIVLIESL